MIIIFPCSVTTCKYKKAHVAWEKCLKTEAKSNQLTEEHDAFLSCQSYFCIVSR